ncbi:MAG: ankyrin repeat domain-containing protein [Planctomycetota bacterium]
MPEQPESVFPSVPPRAFRPIPERPDLDQLKKQAKELLRGFVAGESAALKEVERYFHVGADHALTLSEAQLVLARAYGYASWPKLKAYVDGVNKQALVEAINAGDVDAVRGMLRRRPELAGATTGIGEQQMIHLAVLRDDTAMVRVLMEHGADARRGIYPHREATSAFVMATERGLDEVLSAMHDVERQRQEELSCPNTSVSPEQNELNRLIRRGESDAAIALLQAQPELMKQCDRDGATPLHVACEMADEAVVAWLCEHRADARKVDAYSDTPMDRAVKEAGWFKRERVEPNRRNMRRLRARGAAWTPLGAAAMGEIGELRRMHREQPGVLAEGFSWNRGGVLSAAVTFDQLETVAALLDLGLDVDEKIALGRSTDDEEAVSWGGPIWRAAAYGRHDIARLLLERGADANANVYASGWPLDRAYERGDRAMVELLFEFGAVPSAYTVCSAHDYATAERLLAERGDEPVWVRELVWSAAFCTALPVVEVALPRLMELKDELPAVDGGLQSWHDLLCQPMRISGPSEAVRPAGYRDDDRFKIMRLMLEAGIDPNATGRFGLTLLHFVATIGKRRNAKPYPDADRNRFADLLLDAGADPMMRDALLCSTALGWACRYGCDALVERLLERGVPVEEPDTPAWAQPRAWAAKMGHEAILARMNRWA